jgi:oligopeptide/dipeptide ABC transporter ATP-binding protein
METNSLSIENLSCDFFTIEGTVYVLNGVNLQIKKGEMHGLVGESGCGKSVTSKAILGLLSRNHTRLRGSINFDGLDLLALPEKKMRSVRGKRISMIFQDPLNSLSPLETVGSQIEEAMANHLDLGKEELRRRAASLLEKTGLHSQTAGQYPFELSGGMQQRIMIAQAICCSPEILIADEPTTALDLTIQAQVLRLLKSLQAELSLTVLLITHNFAIVAENCDTVSVMYAGRIVETAPVQELIESPAHPYTSALINCIPDGYSSGKDLPVIPGSPPRLNRPLRSCPFAPRCSKADGTCTIMPPLKDLGGGRSVLCDHPGGAIASAPSRGLDEYMPHVPAQGNSAIFDKGSPPLGGRGRRGRG